MVRNIFKKAAELLGTMSEAIVFGLLYLLIRFFTPPEDEADARLAADPADGRDNARLINCDERQLTMHPGSRLTGYDVNRHWAGEDEYRASSDDRHCPYSWAS